MRGSEHGQDDRVGWVTAKAGHRGLGVPVSSLGLCPGGDEQALRGLNFNRERSLGLTVREQIGGMGGEEVPLRGCYSCLGAPFGGLIRRRGSDLVMEERGRNTGIW